MFDYNWCIAEVQDALEEIETQQSSGVWTMSLMGEREHRTLVVRLHRIHLSEMKCRSLEGRQGEQVRRCNKAQGWEELFGRQRCIPPV